MFDWWRPAVAVGPVLLGFLVLSTVRQALAADELIFAGAVFDGRSGVTGLADIRALVVSPDGRNIYAAGRGDNAIAMFSRDRERGTLGFLGSLFDGQGGVGAIAAVGALVASPDGRHLYAVGERDDSVAVFTRDSVYGHLAFVEALVNGRDGTLGMKTPRDLVLSPDGKHLYVTAFGSDSLLVFARDNESGHLQLVERLRDGAVGVDGLWGASSVAVSPDGRHVYVTGRWEHAVSTFVRDPVSGRLAFVRALFDGESGIDGLDEPFDVAVSPDGRNVYVAAWGDDAVSAFSRDRTSGELNYLEAHFNDLNGVVGLSAPSSLAIGPDGRHVYASGYFSDAVALFERDEKDGTLGFSEALFNGQKGVVGLRGPRGLALSPDGQHLYIASGDNAISAFRRTAADPLPDAGASLNPPAKGTTVRCALPNAAHVPVRIDEPFGAWVSEGGGPPARTQRAARFRFSR